MKKESVQYSLSHPEGEKAGVRGGDKSYHI
jgi:hypothetical protein